MPLNLFWTIRTFGSRSCGWSTNVPTTFYNSTCLTIPTLKWKNTKGQSMILCPSSHNAQTLQSNFTIFEFIDSWSFFSTVYLVWSNFTFLDVSMTMVLHPTHSQVLLHIYMIVGNFFCSLQHIDIGVFFHLPIFH